MTTRERAFKGYKSYSAVRDKKKVTDYRVAKATGIGPSVLSDWKRGKSTPSGDKLLRIATYLNIPVEALIVNG